MKQFVLKCFICYSLHPCLCVLFCNYIVNAVVPLFPRKSSNHPSVIHCIKKEPVKEETGGGKSEAVLHVPRIFPRAGETLVLDTRGAALFLCRIPEGPGAAAAARSSRSAVILPSPPLVLPTPPLPQQSPAGYRAGARSLAAAKVGFKDI